MRFFCTEEERFESGNLCMYLSVFGCTRLDLALVSRAMHHWIQAQLKKMPAKIEEDSSGRQTLPVKVPAIYRKADEVKREKRIRTSTDLKDDELGAELMFPHSYSHIPLGRRTIDIR